MRLGGLLLFLALATTPAYSLDRRPEPAQKSQNQKKTQAAAQPRPAYPGARERISRMESRMIRRDREMDRRMKTQKR